MSPNALDAFQAIADPSRREILMLLSKNKLTMNELANNFDISRPAVSKHVKVLFQSGFINIHEHGRERYCELKHDGFNEIKDWVEFFEQSWKRKLENLEKLLNQQSTQK